MKFYDNGSPYYVTIFGVSKFLDSIFGARQSCDSIFGVQQKTLTWTCPVWKSWEYPLGLKLLRADPFSYVVGSIYRNGKI